MEKKTVNLLEGQFQPNEAKEVINHLCNVQIEFYKLKYLQDLENSLNKGGAIERVEAVQAKKEMLKKYLSEAQSENASVKVSLEISYS